MSPLILTALLVAASPAGGKLFQRDRSPSGRIIAEHVIFEPHHPGWEAPLDRFRCAMHKTPPRLLFEHHRGAGILFSPDGKWIAINDYRFSDEADSCYFDEPQV